MARLNELHQQLSRALGLSAKETAEIERETEMRVAQKDQALSGSLPEDVAAAFRAIVGRDKTEIESETEMRVAQKDEALSKSLPEDVAAAFRGIVGRDKTKHWIAPAGRHNTHMRPQKSKHLRNLRQRPAKPAQGKGRVQRACRRAFLRFEAPRRSSLVGLDTHRAPRRADRGAARRPSLHCFDRIPPELDS